MSYWRYPPEGLHVVGTADVTLKCAEYGTVREVLVRFASDIGRDHDGVDFIDLAIQEAKWSEGDHTVLCSDKCYENMNAYHA